MPDKTQNLAPYDVDIEVETDKAVYSVRVNKGRDIDSAYKQLKEHVHRTESPKRPSLAFIEQQKGLEAAQKAATPKPIPGKAPPKDLGKFVDDVVGKLGGNAPKQDSRTTTQKLQAAKKKPAKLSDITLRPLVDALDKQARGETRIGPVAPLGSTARPSADPNLKVASDAARKLEKVAPKPEAQQIIEEARAAQNPLIQMARDAKMRDQLAAQTQAADPAYYDPNVGVTGGAMVPYTQGGQAGMISRAGTTDPYRNTQRAIGALFTGLAQPGGQWSNNLTRRQKQAMDEAIGTVLPGAAIAAASGGVAAGHMLGGAFGGLGTAMLEYGAIQLLGGAPHDWDEAAMWAAFLGGLHGAGRVAKGVPKAFEALAEKAYPGRKAVAPVAKFALKAIDETGSAVGSAAKWLGRLAEKPPADMEAFVNRATGGMRAPVSLNPDLQAANAHLTALVEAGQVEKAAKLAGDLLGTSDKYGRLYIQAIDRNITQIQQEAMEGLMTIGTADMGTKWIPRDLLPSMQQLTEMVQQGRSDLAEIMAPGLLGVRDRELTDPVIAHIQNVLKEGEAKAQAAAVAETEAITAQARAAAAPLEALNAAPAAEPLLGPQPKIALVGPERTPMTSDQLVEDTWRKRTQAAINEAEFRLSKPNDTNMGAKKWRTTMARLRDLRRDLKASLETGQPHPVVENEIRANHARLMREQAVEVPKNPVVRSKSALPPEAPTPAPFPAKGPPAKKPAKARTPRPEPGASKAPEPAAKQVSEPVPAQVDAALDDLTPESVEAARARLRKNFEQHGRVSLPGIGISKQTAQDLANYARFHIKRGMQYAEWVKDVAKHVGKTAVAYAKAAWERALKIIAGDARFIVTKRTNRGAVFPAGDEPGPQLVDLSGAKTPPIKMAKSLTKDRIDATSQEIYDAVIAGYGTTYDVASASTPTRGYSVAHDKKHGWLETGPVEDFSPAVVKAYLEKHKNGILKMPATSVGVWIEDGKYFLEPAQVFETRAQAEWFGKARYQHAIGDLKAYSKNLDGTIYLDYSKESPFPGIPHAYLVHPVVNPKTGGIGYGPPVAESDVALKLIHYSDTPGLTELDPAKAGTGVGRGKEAPEVVGEKNYRATPWFYMEGGRTETQLRGAKYQYETTVPFYRLYPADRDPLGLAEGLLGPEAVAAAIDKAKAKGFLGVIATDPGDKVTRIRMFDTTPVRQTVRTIEGNVTSPKNAVAISGKPIKNQLSPKQPEAPLSAATIQAAAEELHRYPAAGLKKTVALARDLQTRTSGIIQTLGLALGLDAKGIETLGRTVMNEVGYQIQQPNSGYGFYRQGVMHLEEAAKQLIPGLKDPAQMSWFHAISSMLSPSATPADETQEAILAYRAYLRDGKVPLLRSEATTYTDGRVEVPWAHTNAASMDVLNTVLTNANGNERAATIWLLSKHPLEEVAAVNPNIAIAKLDLQGNVYGAYAMGPKVGSYFLNKHGIASEITKDLWFFRAWGRVTATMLDTFAKDAKIKQALGDTHLDRVMNKLQDEVLRKAARKLGMTPAEVQEVWWQFERELYYKHGLQEKGATALEGVLKVAKEEGKDIRGSWESAREGSGVADAAGRAADTGGGGQGSSGGAGEAAAKEGLADVPTEAPVATPPKVLYHVTGKGNAESIAKEGLRADEMRGLVWGYSSIEDARAAAKKSWGGSGGDNHIYEVNVEGKVVKPDPDAKGANEGAWVVEGGVAADRVKLYGSTDAPKVPEGAKVPFEGKFNVAGEIAPVLKSGDYKDVYIPIDKLPKPKVRPEVDREYLKKLDLAIVVRQDEKGVIHILDGNNRLDVWREQGYTHAPAKLLVEPRVARPAVEMTKTEFKEATGAAHVSKDNPGGEWLERQQQQASEYLKKNGRYREFGSTTMAVDGVEVPVSELVKLPGMRDEHLKIKPGDSRVAELAGKIKAEGMTTEPFINVEFDGMARINEGNHRVRAAQAAGLEKIKVQISYFDGGEGAPGAMSPQKLVDFNAKPGAGGGGMPHIPEAPSKWAGIVDGARSRMKQRGSQLNTMDPSWAVDMAIIGADVIRKGAVDFAEFSAQMVKQLGKGVEPHLQEAWDTARKALLRKGMLPEGFNALSAEKELTMAGLEAASKKFGYDLPKREGFSESPADVQARAVKNFAVIDRSLQRLGSTELNPSLSREEHYVGGLKLNQLGETIRTSSSEIARLRESGGSSAEIAVNQIRLDEALQQHEILSNLLYKSNSMKGRELQFLQTAIDGMDEAQVMTMAERLSHGKIPKDARLRLTSQVGEVKKAASKVDEAIAKREAQANKIAAKLKSQASAGSLEGTRFKLMDFDVCG